MKPKEQAIPRYEDDGGFNILFNMNDSVIIELVGKGFDGHELTRNGMHERYQIPWSEVLFIRDKSDLIKNNMVQTYIIEQEDYKKTRESRKLLDLLINLKQNVIEYSKDKEGLVETSGNIGIVEVLNGKSKITELIRSSDDNKKDEIKDNNNSFAQKYGYNVYENSSYPGWKYRPNSKIENVYIQSYKEVHNQEEPIVCAIHAGVECGMIYKKMPQLEMISIGPDIVDVHTVNETLYLKSCKKFLTTLIEMINKLAI